MTNQPNPLIQQNLLDKVIAYVAPGIAKKRMASRAQLALAGGYSGARIDRAQLSRWMPTAGSPNVDTIRDLPMLRARSRDQMRNAPVALGALNTQVSHVVGTGLTYTPAIDANYLRLTAEQAAEWSADTKRRFETWAGSPDCDLARELDFYGIQELAFRSFMESGDCFVVTPRVQRPGRAAQLALQLLEADHICNPDRKPDTDTLIDGVEIDPSTGEKIRVHIAKKHPGGINCSGNTWTPLVMRGSKTGRRNVLHILKPLRPSQVRGVPWVAPILEPLKQLGRWSDAELNAAVVSSAMAVFLKMDPEAFETLYDDDAQGAIVSKASEWSGEMDSGKAINLLPGESVESPTPGRPNPAFDPFWVAMVRQIGMALEMPFEVLVMHFQSSYSAARAALLMAWKAFRSKRDLLTKTLCQPVFELWLDDEVAAGRINCPGYFADPVVKAAWCKAIWTGDGPGSIDPGKEVDAAQKRVDLGISTKQAESIAFDGVDWQQKHDQRVKEINAEKRDGIYVPPAGSPTQPGNAAPEPDADNAEAAQKKASDAKARATADALEQLSRRVDSLASAPQPSITVNPPAVTIHQGDTHVHQAATSIQQGDIHTHLPEGMVTLEATVQAPIVQMEVPPAQVVVQAPTKQAMRQVHKCDADGNLVETLITPID